MGMKLSFALKMASALMLECSVRFTKAVKKGALDGSSARLGFGCGKETIERGNVIKVSRSISEALSDGDAFDLREAFEANYEMITTLTASEVLVCMMVLTSSHMQALADTVGEELDDYSGGEGPSGSDIIDMNFMSVPESIRKQPKTPDEIARGGMESDAEETLNELNDLVADFNDDFNTRKKEDED